MELLSWLADDLYAVSFLVILFSSLWRISSSPLCVLWCSIVTTTEHKGVKEKSFTKKKTEWLGNWLSVFSRTDHQGSQDQDSSPMTPIRQYKGNNLSWVQQQSIHSCTAVVLWLAYWAAVQKNWGSNPTAFQVYFEVLIFFLVWHFVMTNVKINSWFLFCFSGRRMGGNNMSTLERICAQCQGKVAHFEIVRIIHFNFYKKTTSTHPLFL